MPHLMCQIKGCLEKAEYDVHDGRPWIYHKAKDGSIHCAGANPNNKPTIHQYVPKTEVQAKSRLRDHLLQEYYNFDFRRQIKQEEEDDI